LISNVRLEVPNAEANRTRAYAGPKENSVIQRMYHVFERPISFKCNISCVQWSLISNVNRRIADPEQYVASALATKIVTIASLPHQAQCAT
jgi:hypothetical protein